MLSVGSLFTGIGMLDYGLHLAGLTDHRWVCEQDEWRLLCEGSNHHG